MPTNRNTADPGKPRRRWFQFRLRTLLIAVALLSIPCGYVAHEAAIVRARKRFIADQRGSFEESSFGILNYTIRDYRSPELDNWLRSMSEAKHSAKSPSWVRRWLGDTAYYWVLTNNLSDFSAAIELFPEAGVECFDGESPERFSN